MESCKVQAHRCQSTHSILHVQQLTATTLGTIRINHTACRFVAFEDEASVQAVFAAGSIQEIAGKRVEVKTATPKGSGPIGRGPGLLLGQRLGMPGAAVAGRYPEGMTPYPGLGPAGYPMPGAQGRVGTQ